jgi:hypothetical protein
METGPAPLAALGALSKPAINAAAAAAHTRGRAFLNLITEPFDIVVTHAATVPRDRMLEVLVTIVKES